MRWLYSMAIVIALAMQGCSTTQVYSDRVKGVDFSKYKTYAWLPNAKDTTDSDNVLNSDITNENIHSAADKEMARRGYVLDPNNPDILLMLHTSFEKRHETVRSPIYSSYNYYYPGFYAGPWYPFYYNGYNTMPYITGYDMREIQYTEGTVVIDAIDRAKHELVWRGWSEQEIDDQSDANKMYKHVEDIFDKYPVKAMKKK